MKHCVSVLFVRLQDPQVFTLIQRYGLFEEIEANIEELMDLNINESITLFLKHKERLTPTLVVRKLDGNRYFQFMVNFSLNSGENARIAVVVKLFLHWIVVPRCSLQS